MLGKFQRALVKNFADRGDALAFSSWRKGLPPIEKLLRRLISASGPVTSTLLVECVVDQRRIFGAGRAEEGFAGDEHHDEIRRAFCGLVAPAREQIDVLA